MHGRDLALERLVDKAARRGYAIAWDLLRDRAEAEDAVQEALARACAEYARLRDAAALEGWFFRVLSNVCLRALRRRRLARVFGWLWPAEPRAREREDAGDRERLLAEITRLPPMQQAVVVLRFGQDLATEEIATLLDVGDETVKTHLKRGMARLRARLGEKA